MQAVAAIQLQSGERIERGARQFDRPCASAAPARPSAIIGNAMTLVRGLSRGTVEFMPEVYSGGSRVTDARSVVTLRTFSYKGPRATA